MINHFAWVALLLTLDTAYIENTDYALMTQHFLVLFLSDQLDNIKNKLFSFYSFIIV